MEEDINKVFEDESSQSYFEDIIINERNRKKLIKSYKNGFKDIPGLGESVNFKIIGSL